MTGSGDGVAQLWDAGRGTPIGSPMRHEDEIRSVAFSPDGRYVLTASWDNTARCWSASDGSPVGPPMAHRDNVYTAVFSPDGTRIVTAGRDEAVRIWPGPSSDGGDPAAIERRVQVETGLELDEWGGLHRLGVTAWKGRRLGGR